ncbi:O-succinylhomoserine sulfhydrylase [Thiopseudomonas alkaliphila]|uniref:O-succinylhomoserine sulfhydrylase n=1 Tax=Thiopseudomonas alkaliphila TaxID=1697053 RepID=UPI00069D881E|nr:O-succinylhomoserine sulfhydrylase [Thiopseudomonas alkaliphila]AKX43673.1 O-succinylhomoserine sulfhydrylase [Thiopseudomonas alkaliphila]AKX51672.1 O-succinylhomoserine sulfhydrylase [Thiopseudomonas alkaliphila]AKX55921.1 O-succinylhomoserine sulfhydrylase [Thiopseudomonas alkaliphila]AKX58008.1 O-succinylhomoserine sulfhydrylase [Thiopseudomonas alkaliphila]
MSNSWDAGRLNSDLTGAQPSTLAVREGHQRTAEAEHSEPLFLSSSYVFNSAAQAAASFAGTESGNVYSRYTNPTVAIFEKRLAALEQAEQAVATSSGMAAIWAVVMAFCQAGDHILVSRSVFGATVSLFEKYAKKFGIEVEFIGLADHQQWREACKANTRLLFIESPSNPLAEVADIRALSQIAHEAEALLVVDNCFCTPVLQQPLTLGADIVVHSATKFIDGQGRCLGGAVLGAAALMKEVVGVLRTTGPTLSPFNAWTFLKGLETLKLRMQAHCASSLALAEWLARHPKVQRVFYAGLASHPQHELAKRQQRGFGAVVGFEIAGAQEQAWRFIDATRMISITANLGDTKTTITHPASTTHGRLSPEERAQAGIQDNLIRLSVGLEDLEDIKRDLELGFSAI